jgi:hypothetical protein
MPICVTDGGWLFYMSVEDFAAQARRSNWISGTDETPVLARFEIARHEYK